MVDKDLAAVLKMVGFNEKEARTYLALLELGKATATQVAKRAELKRSIVYYVLRHLEKRGYVQETAVGKIKHFAAADPTRVLQNVQSATEELRFMLPLMRALYDKGSDRPKIEYLEGKEAILSVYRMYSQMEGMRFATSIRRMNRIIPEETERWITIYTKSKRSLRSRQFIEDTAEDRHWAQRMQKSREEVRFFPSHVHMAMDLSIGEGIVSLTSFDPLFIVVIHSKPIAASAAALFDLAWQSGKETKQTSSTS